MKIVTSFVLTASLAVIGVSTSVAQAAIVQNGGFETGDFTGWTTSNLNYSGVVDNSTNDSYSGNYFASLGPIGSLGFLSQNIPTIIGQPYELSFFLKNQSPNAFPNQFQIFLNGNNIFNQVNINPLDYTKYSFNFTATAISTELKFGVRHDPGHLFLDDVNVIPTSVSVTEPLTLVGTVITGVIGLWAKRK